MMTSAINIVVYSRYSGGNVSPLSVARLPIFLARIDAYLAVLQALLPLPQVDCMMCINVAYYKYHILKRLVQWGYPASGCGALQ